MTTLAQITPLSSDLHRIGGGFSVRWHISVRCGEPYIECDWWPRTPTRRQLKRIEKRYKAARHVFMEEVAARLGAPVTCVDL